MNKSMFIMQMPVVLGICSVLAIPAHAVTANTVVDDITIVNGPWGNKTADVVCYYRVDNTTSYTPVDISVYSKLVDTTPRANIAGSGGTNKTVGALTDDYVPRY